MRKRGKVGWRLKEISLVKSEKEGKMKENRDTSESIGEDKKVQKKLS